MQLTTEQQEALAGLARLEALLDEAWDAADGDVLLLREQNRQSGTGPRQGDRQGAPLRRGGARLAGEVHRHASGAGRCDGRLGERHHPGSWELRTTWPPTSARSTYPASATTTRSPGS